jgi:para-aminobenzoate synthetase component I
MRSKSILLSELKNKELQKCARLMNDFGSRRQPFFFIIDYLAKKPLVILASDLEKGNIYFQFPKSGRVGSLQNKSQSFQIKTKNLSYQNYQASFQKIMEHIRYGNTYLANLTCQTEIEISLSLKEVYTIAQAPYKIFFRDEWVCFSPECFIKIKDGLISSYPMKGTIDKNIPGAESIILNDEKELAEHYTIVDLIRNDLSMVAENVEVKRFRYVDTIKTNNKTLLQVSSEITGVLPRDYYENIGNTICSLLPAGSVTGAPKTKTVEIIKEAENYDRGYYTGVAGYFDGKDVDSCVLIRFIEKTGDGFVYKSGGGITLFSDVKKEFNEMTDKIYVPAT